MAKNFIQRLLSFEGDVANHVKSVIKQEERPAEAWQEISRHGRRLVNRVVGGGPSDQRKEAIHYLKKGMEAFNQQRFERAEALFRRSLKHDPEYARAHLYLGNTLYKAKRLTEAFTHWSRATECEPNSDAAAQARSKLLHVNHGGNKALEMLRDEMRTQ